MDTGESKRAVIVGIFIALGIVIFLVGIFTLGSNQKSFGGGLQISAVFDDVAGLKKGGAVWFSGVKVGTINSIQFVGTSEVNVKMTIGKDVQSYIHRNSGAHISSDGLIGNKIIVIDGGKPNAPVIQNGDVLQTVKLVSTDDITKTLQDNNLNILAITNDLKKVSREMAEGKGMVGALMGDTVLALKFRSIVDNLKQTTNTTNRMAAELEKFGTKLNSKGTLADNLLTDTSTYRQIKIAVSNLQNSTANTEKIIENLNGKLNSKDNAVGQLLNDPERATQVKVIFNNVQKASVQLNDDLEALQHNWFLKGFFKDREKDKADSLKKAGKN